MNSAGLTGLIQAVLMLWALAGLGYYLNLSGRRFSTNCVILSVLIGFTCLCFEQYTKHLPRQIDQLISTQALGDVLATQETSVQGDGHQSGDGG